VAGTEIAVGALARPAFFTDGQSHDTVQSQVFFRLRGARVADCRVLVFSSAGRVFELPSFFGLADQKGAMTPGGAVAASSTGALLLSSVVTPAACCDTGALKCLLFASV